MRLEIGGGTRQRGEGFANLDICEGADIRHDLDITPWPIDDESIDEVYTSHCIEHVKCYISFVREVVRICRVGATVEIRCPDANSEMAMVAGHRAVFPINVVRHLDTVFPEIFWNGDRRLRLLRFEQCGDDYWLPLARQDWPDKSDEFLMRWIPRTCHENRFYFKVTENDCR